MFTKIQIPQFVYEELASAIRRQVFPSAATEVITDKGLILPGYILVAAEQTAEDRAFNPVRQILADMFKKWPQSITPSTRLIEDLEADSLDLVEIILELEDWYDIDIHDEDVTNIKTASDLQKLAERLSQ